MQKEINKNMKNDRHCSGWCLDGGVGGTHKSAFRTMPDTNKTRATDLNLRNRKKSDSADMCLCIPHAKGKKINIMSNFNNAK